MKKLLSLLLAFISLISVSAFAACEQVFCDHVAGSEIYYEENASVVTISYQCTKCEKGSDDIIETVKVDAVVTPADKNGLSIAQDKIDDDMAICLKKGEYSQIYFGDPKKAVRILCEEGTKVKVAQLNGDADSVTFENASFISDPEAQEGANVFKFEPAGGSRYWSNITIKNCYFEGNAYIDSAWKDGVIDNLTVDNCTFINTTDDYGGELQGSAKSSIFIDEVWGTTTIKNCTFDTPEYNAIRIGNRSIEGDIIIENCSFKGTRRSRVIYVTAKNNVTLTVNNCVFDEDNTCIYFPISSGVVGAELYVGANKWKHVPDTVMNATYYNPLEQEML